jgi:hypothetical protein
MENFLKIPLVDGDKKPSLSGWSGATPEKLNALDMLAKDSQNHGILCGKTNGIIVLDYDIHKIPETDPSYGNYHLESMLGVHGENCYIVQTTSGGFHVYHEFTEDVENWKGICGINGFVDIRTTGNYVVGPGSTVNGKEYKLLHSPPDGKIGPIPPELYEAYNEHQKPKTKKQYEDVDHQEAAALLEQNGFTGVSFISDYNFDCNQKGRGATCPCCEQEHRSNNFFIFKNETGLYVRNHSERCRRLKLKSTFMFSEEEKQLIEKEGFEQNYVAMKRKFEKNVCFIERGAQYVVESEDGRMDILNTQKLKDRFIHYSFPDEKNKPKSFIQSWIKDRTKRSYLKLDFLPEGCPDNVYNLWKGYEVESIADAGGDNVEPFLTLVNQLTRDDPDYFMKWLAQLFQKPGAKPITSPVFSGPQGTGKNTLFDLIGKLMGNELYYETADADNNLFGRFSTALEKKKLLFIDEMEGSSAFKNSSKLKAMITNTRHNIERKNMDIYECENLAGIVFASNNSTPVKIETTDRRFFSYHTKKDLDQAFFDRWYEWIKVASNRRAVYDYLMNIDISNVNWIGDRPVNRAYYEMKFHALPSTIKWLEHTITEEFPKAWVGKPVKMNDLYNKYREYGHTTEKSVVQLGKEFKRLIEKEDLVGFDKGPMSKGRATYMIDRKAVFTWLKEKQFTLADKLEDELELDDEDTYGDY